jgi:hypothetical protein
MQQPTLRAPAIVAAHGRQQNSSGEAHESAGPIRLQGVVADTHWPFRIQQVSTPFDGENPQGRAWHLPLEQAAPLSQLQPQKAPGGLVIACSNAAAY